MPKSILGLVRTQWYDFISEISEGGLYGSSGLSAETVRYNISVKYGGSAGFWLTELYPKERLCFYPPLRRGARGDLAHGATTTKFATEFK
jgi:hypothetical protein